MRKLLFAAALFAAVSVTAQTQQVNTKTLIAKDSFNLDGIWRKYFPGGTTVTGGIVTWVSGLTFAVTSAEYNIKNKAYKSNGGTITLNPAHSTLPRIDVIALDTSRSIVKITGTAAASPAIPQINPATQVYLTAVLVGAGATSPTGVTSMTVYNENTEWATGGSSTFPTANFASTAAPQSGTVSIDVTGTNSANDVSASGGFKMFNGANTYNYSDYTVLRFYIRLKQAWTASASIQVGLGNGGEPLTTITAANGFNPGLVGVYQNISVPLSQIPKTSNSFSAFYFFVTGNGKGFYLDNVQLQGGVGGGSGSGYVTDVFKSNDSVFVVKDGIKIFAFMDSGTGGGGGISDGNKGDITVSGTGTNWQINSNAVGNSEIANSSVSQAKISGTLDSVVVPQLHSENYYNGKYKNIAWLPALNDIQGATGTSSINHGGNWQQWAWDGNFGTVAFNLTSTPTVTYNGTQLLNTQLLGANTSSGQTSITGKFINVKTGASSTNIALDLSAQNGTNNYALRVQPNGGFSGFSVINPSAFVHVGAGTATQAPFKLTSGTALSTPQDGTIEYHGGHLYFTIGSTRYQIDQQGGGGGSITDVTASAPLTVTGTTTKNIAADTTTAITGLMTKYQASKMQQDSSFDVVGPVVNGTQKLFNKISSTKLQIRDVKNSPTVTWTVDADSNLVASSTGGGGGITDVTASAPLTVTGTTTKNIGADTTTAISGLMTKYQASKMQQDSSFDVVRPVVNGTQKLFNKISSTKLQIRDVKNTPSVTWSVDADSNVTATATDLRHPVLYSLASAFSSTSTTLADVTGWSVSVTAGSTYKIEIIADYQTAATTTGGTLGLYLPSGVGTIRGFAEADIAQTAAATGLKAPIRAIGTSGLSGSTLTSTGVGVITSPHSFYLLVTFTCTTSGTLTAQWATEVAASASQLNAGSSLIVTQLN